MASQGAQDELAGRQERWPVEIGFDVFVKVVSTNSALFELCDGESDSESERESRRESHGEGQSQG